jgi:hypothetical protein
LIIKIRWSNLSWTESAPKMAGSSQENGDTAATEGLGPKRALPPEDGAPHGPDSDGASPCKRQRTAGPPESTSPVVHVGGATATAAARRSLRSNTSPPPFLLRRETPAPSFPLPGYLTLEKERKWKAFLEPFLRLALKTDCFWSSSAGAREGGEVSRRTSAAGFSP